jgi:dipeptidyl aminopeptidase/acylaminoacyl peptidase
VRPALVLIAWIAAVSAANASPDSISVRDLFANPAFTSPRISADGKRVAVLASQGDTQIVVSRALAGGPLAPHGKLSSPTSRFSWLAWAKPDVLWVGASTESGPRSFLRFRATNLHAISLASGEVKSIGWAPRVLSWLADDPERVLVEGSRGVTTMGAFDGVIAEKPVFRDRRRVLRWHADAAGVVRAGEIYENGKYELLARTRDGQALEAAIEWDAREGEGPLFLDFHDDPNKLYVRKSHEGRTAIFSLDLTTGALELALADPSFDVTTLALDPASERVLGARYVADRPVTRFFAAREESERASIHAALERARGRTLALDLVSRDRAGRVEIWEIHGDTQPPAFYIHDRKRRALTLLFSERPQLEDAALAPARRIEIVARDGLRLPSYLTLPVNGPQRNLPTIVLAHGGPTARDAIDWNPEVQLFASRGFAVIQVNFRGSEGFGSAFLEAGYREWGGKMQNDLSDAVKQLVAEGISDPDRVGIYGASYGGFAALMGLVVNPETYRAGAAYAAVTDVRTLLTERRFLRDKYTKARLAEEIGGGWDDRHRIRAASPKRRASEIRVPVLLGHGEADLVVSVRHSRDMASALRRAGTFFEYLEFPHEIHGFLLEASRVKWYEALIAFFEKNLAPRAAAAPAAEAPAAAD